MHYHFEVWIPKDSNIEFHVEEALQPYKDKLWDWWQIGGRWKGAHEKDYDPQKDPQNQKPCDHPYVRHNGLPDSECQYCKGTGITTAWPTQWTRHKADVLPVSEVHPDLTCNTLIVPGKAVQIEEWNGDTWTKTGFDGKVAAELKKQGMFDGFVVTVDCHD